VDASFLLVDEPGLRASFLGDRYAFARIGDVCGFRYADDI
jgi:hypothetical protein